MRHSVTFSTEKRKDKSGTLIAENVPIRAEVRYQGNRLTYFVGYRVSLQDFDNMTGLKPGCTGIEGKTTVSAATINKRLKRIKAEVTVMLDDATEVSRQQIIAKLDVICGKGIESEPAASSPLEFLEMLDYYQRVCKLSENRKKRLTSIKNHWLHYSRKRKIAISWQTLTVEVLRDFERYLASESLSAKGRNRKPVLIKKGRNTIHTIMAQTRTFWNFAAKELKRQGIDIPQPFGAGGYQVPAEVYGTPIFLTINERNQLLGAPLDSERLQRVRDIFVFQCFIGCRLGDLVKLTKENVQDNAIIYTARKTVEGRPVAVRVPLHPKAQEILNRYDLPGGMLLPFISETQYNAYLKELFEVVGLNRTVTRRNPTTGKPEQIKLSAIASSHLARRTFVAGLYGKVDTGVISSMSGHTPGSRAFNRYYSVSENLQDAAIQLLD